VVGEEGLEREGDLLLERDLSRLDLDLDLLLQSLRLLLERDLDRDLGRILELFDPELVLSSLRLLLERDLGRNSELFDPELVLSSLRLLLERDLGRDLGRNLELFEPELVLSSRRLLLERDGDLEGDFLDLELRLGGLLCGSPSSCSSSELKVKAPSSEIVLAAPLSMRHSRMPCALV